MKKSELFGSVLVGATMMWAAPALAQDAPSNNTTVVQAPAPAAAPAAPAATPVVVAASSRSEGSPALYPGLVWGGLTIFGLSYGASAVGGAVANDVCDADSNFCIKGRGIMFVPVFGPFVAAGNVDGKGTSTMRTLLILDGAFQAGGLAMMISGLVMSAAAKSHTAMLAPPKVAERKVNIVPLTTPSFAGLGAIGRF